MLIPFIKMNAQGNDFVILNYFHEVPHIEDPARFAAEVCDRNFGVGADGLVILKPCPDADAQMIIFNNDGSRAEMCGSALRCVSSLLLQTTSKTAVDILTDSGLKHASMEQELITVNLGKPILLQQEMPVDIFKGDLVDIGNPHYIVFQEDISDDPHLKYGSMLEHHPDFEAPVNVHFVQVLNGSAIRMKIWEHACGATLACGTGAASAVFAGINRGMLDSSVEVEVPGGTLFISTTANGQFLLTGTVSMNFRGTYLWRT